MMKTAEKLAAGWLLTLGFMFMTLSVSATIDKIAMQQPMPSYGTDKPRDYFNDDAYAVYDLNAKQGLIFGVPTLVLGGWLTLSLYRRSQQEKKALNQEMSDRLQSTFYRMIQENNGRITLLSFAMHSELPAKTARQYLDDRAREFNANFKVNEDGAVSYHFDV